MFTQYYSQNEKQNFSGGGTTKLKTNKCKNEVSLAFHLLHYKH